MTGNEIRDSFLRFFADRGHRIVPSASLIPANDPTLLFTNAGMVPFKNIFLGMEQPTHPRVVDAQKCLRVSGKHNDLEEVGRDTYHHTFFEMLGTWSFGDYYKAEAIGWAWELLTEVWQLPSDRLWASVYTTDDEADELWRTKTTINPDQILRFGDKDNFWEMGETGPCGPCSEIHIDRGPGACDRVNTPGHTCEVNTACPRFIELWNLVFIQHNRNPDRSLNDLPARHVDTGMGLERIAAVLQGVPGNYDADLLRDTIRAAEALSTTCYGSAPDSDISLRVIADHARAAAFAIADGVVPSNEGRGYVLRRIVRRALRHGRLLGLEQPFLWRVADRVVALMGAAYPALRERRDYLSEVIRTEEARFSDTLARGLALLEHELSCLRSGTSTRLSGEIAFRLYDTYGFPPDLTQDILSSEGLGLDQAGFERAMAGQRNRARAGRKPLVSLTTDLSDLHSRFVGDRITEWESEIVAVLLNGTVQHRAVGQGETVDIVTAETPFYGESGGQVGDRGRLETSRGDIVEIVDTQTPQPLLTIHRGRVSRGAIQTGDRVRLILDTARREATRLNHSATHVMHAALRQVLGSHVRQAGSLVTPDRLRFDFTHTSPLKPDELEQIETLVNAHIRENAQVSSDDMSLNEALKSGALAFFGEKYGERVRVVRMGDFSTELCGGTHIGRTGDIGLFKLKAESGVAAGVRRLEATTGGTALGWVRHKELLLKELGTLVKGAEEEVADKIARLLAQQRELEKQLAALQSQVAGSQSDAILGTARQLNGIKVLASRVDGVDATGLREMADRLRDKLQPGVIVLGVVNGDRVSLLATVSKDIAGRYQAGDLMKQLAPIVGGGGGGRSDFAQAGGKDPTRLDEALQKVYELIEHGS